ncbi:MAG: MBL fold metallo-hydrolase [Ruminococcaceae bacterium]|nr:MBL fold metallo-hydrolase [Oscillospiraceae bacterium]
MIAHILFSSSKGNCTLVRHEGTQILIDCGKSARAVCTAINDAGGNAEKIDAVFITHEHSDHTSALDVLCSKKEFDIHTTKKSAPKLLSKERVAPHVVIHETEYEVTVGTLTVKSFPLPHDSADHVGYIITDTEGDVLGIATDMGHITKCAEENLSSCKKVIIEANHDHEMLMEGPYPADLKRRILSKRGHLSNTDCSLLACTLAKAGCKAFVLAHISPENNTPEIAHAEVRCALDSEGFSDLPLECALPDFPVKVG